VEYRPSISVIVPVAPGGDVSNVLNSLSGVRYPLDKVEVLVVEGRNPSHQRNEAAKSAKGEILYFMDNDVIVDKWMFRNITDMFEDESVSVVGGPSVTPESDTLLQKSFGYVLASVFGGFIAREKFVPLGPIRAGSEKELILCNLAIRRKAFEEAGGFNPRLYPNEENELLNRLQAEGHRIIYHPLVIVYRSQRKNLFEFARQLFNYGRGRFEHFRVTPKFAEPVFAIPSLFVLYLLSLPFLWGFTLYRIPLFLYLMVNLSASISLGLGARNIASILVTPVAFFVLHVSYGTGFMWGALKTALRLRGRRDMNVNMNSVKEFGAASMGDCGPHEISVS